MCFTKDLLKSKIYCMKLKKNCESTNSFIKKTLVDQEY